MLQALQVGWNEAGQIRSMCVAGSNAALMTNNVCLWCISTIISAAAVFGYMTPDAAAAAISQGT
jgi:hypothetical protein